MSRIEEAFKRIARREVGEAAAGKSSLDRFAFEDAAAPSRTLPVPIPARRLEAAPPLPMSAPGVGDTAADEPLVDFRQIWDYVGFVARSIVRHPYVATLTLVLMLGATALTLAVWPRTYHVEARLLAQQNSMMSSFAVPRASSNNPADSPTFAVAETVMRHDNLVALIKQTDLLNQWEQTRPAALRAKDRIVRVFRGAPSEAERMDAMIGLLEQRFANGINVTPEGAVVIGIDWPDGRVAYDLIEAALQNFLDARQAGEASELSDSIAVLERYAATLENDVNATFAQVQAEQAKHAGVRRATLPPVVTVTPPSGDPVPAVPGLPSPPPEVMVRLGRIRASLDAKRTEVARLEEAKAQQVSDLQGKLATALTIYTEDHPTVSSLRQSLASVSKDSPQLQQARAEAQALERDYVTLSAAQEKPPVPQVTAPASDLKEQDARGRGKASAPKPTPSSLAAALAADRPADAAQVGAGPNEYSSMAAVRLRLQVAQLGDIRDRIASGRLALATSQAGFKYRYEMTRPPQVPRAPIKPKVPLVVAGGMLGAMLLAVAAAVFRDLFSGRIVEPWQIERQLGVPVLGHVRRP